MRRVTANASHDDLTDQDYRDIYAELRTGRSLRQFIALIGSGLSAARWSQWEAGARPLSRQMRQELRAAVGLAELPPAVAEAMAAVEPDADIWQVGTGTADRVMLIARPGPISFHWNGDGPEEIEQAPTRAAVTPVTRPGRRYRYWRPALPQELGRRAKEAGITNEELSQAIEALIGGKG